MPHGHRRGASYLARGLSRHLAGLEHGGVSEEAQSATCNPESEIERAGRFLRDRRPRRPFTPVHFNVETCFHPCRVPSGPSITSPAMQAAEFKKKWHRYTGKESAAYQEHFNDLCRLLGQPTPAEADPSGSDFFCFQKRVVKDAELLGSIANGIEMAEG